VKSHSRELVADCFRPRRHSRKDVRVLCIIGLTTAGIALGPTQLLAKGDKAHGEELFMRYCQGCHGPDGRGGGKSFMPHVGPLAQKGYIDRLTDDDLTFVIKEGGAAVGKSGYMPAWEKTLSDADIADVIAFIRTFVAE
jgi:mono/diheme cytochrome c family protein